MPSGGARARSGPAPDPNALRRDRPSDQAQWVTLPAEGRQGPPPKWPLTAATKRESALWAEVWATPQAVEWERLGQEQMVAFYVRRLTVAEKRNCPANALTIVRQLAEALGLTSPGMDRNRWRIAKKAAAEGSPPPTVARIESARERLRVVVEDAVERP